MKSKEEAVVLYLSVTRCSYRWPILTEIQGLDQFRSGILQQQKALMQSAQSFNQIQFLNPQQRQLLLQAQQNLTSPMAGDFDSRRLRMLLNNRSSFLGKDVQTNSIGDIIPNVGSPLQTSCQVLPCADKEMLIKVYFSYLYSSILHHTFRQMLV